MNFLEVLSAVANILTALSVTAHFLHSVWKCRTSVSVRAPCMELESVGTQVTDVEERGSVPEEEEVCLEGTPGTGPCTREGSEEGVPN